MGRGIPPGWDRVEQQVLAHYGRTLHLEVAEDPIGLGGAYLNIYLDGKLDSMVGFSWPDDMPEDDVLRMLIADVGEMLVQELRNELGRDDGVTG